MDYYVLSAVSEENRCAEYVDDETGLRYLTPGAARFSIEPTDGNAIRLIADLKLEETA